MTFSFIITCNPNPDSLTHHFRKQIDKALNDHEVQAQHFDLYKAPLRYQMSLDDMTAYHNGQPFEDLRDVFDQFIKADTLIFVFPVWMYGPPSPLKGLLERLIRPGLTFEITNQGVKPLLTNIKKLIFVCSSGQRNTYKDIHHDPVHHMFYYMMKDNFSPDCELHYHRLFGTDHLKPGHVDDFAKILSDNLTQIFKPI